MASNCVRLPDTLCEGRHGGAAGDSMATSAAAEGAPRSGSPHSGWLLFELFVDWPFTMTGAPNAYAMQLLRKACAPGNMVVTAAAVLRTPPGLSRPALKACVQSGRHEARLGHTTHCSIH
jgi:hypothetical protein